MARTNIHLSLDAKAVERGERYSALHSTTLSQLVSDFLSRLPLDEDEDAELTPTVRRLLGVASGNTDRDDYRTYLAERHGRQGS